MKCYSVAEIEMTDQGWVRTYVQNVTRPVEQRGGRGRRSSTGCGVYRVHGALSEDLSLAVAKISRNAFETAPEMRIHGNDKALTQNKT